MEREKFLSSVYMIIKNKEGQILLQRRKGTVKINEPNKCSELVWCSIENLPYDMIDFEKEAIINNQKGIKFSVIYVDNEKKLIKKR